MGGNSLDIRIIIAAVGLFIAAVTIIGNWIAIKVSYGKDIKSHGIRLDRHSLKLEEIDEDIRLTQTLIGCGEWRKEMEKNMDRLERTFEKQVNELSQDFKRLDEKEEKRTTRMFDKLDNMQKEINK